MTLKVDSVGPTQRRGFDGTMVETIDHACKDCGGMRLFHVSLTAIQSSLIPKCAYGMFGFPGWVKINSRAKL
jgi:hypothetical protein